MSEQQRAWAQARVTEAGGVDAACPDGFTQKAWREACRELGVKAPRFAKIRTLEAALAEVARRASA